MAAAEEEGGEVGGAVPRDLPIARSVGAHHVELEARREDEAALEEAAVLGEVLGARGARRAVDEPLAVVAEEGAAVVAGCRRQPLDVASVRRHRIEVEVAVSHRREDDPASVRRDRRLRVVAGRRRDPPRVGAVRARDDDVVAREESPDVALRAIRRLGTSIRGEMRRRVEDLLPIGEEVRARRPALPRRDETRLGSLLGEVEDEDLVALVRRTRRLEDELPAVGGPVRFRVLAAEGELPNVGEMVLTRIRKRREDAFERRRGSGRRGRAGPAFRRAGRRGARGNEQRDSET